MLRRILTDQQEKLLTDERGWLSDLRVALARFEVTSEDPQSTAFDADRTELSVDAALSFAPFPSDDPFYVPPDPLPVGEPGDVITSTIDGIGTMTNHCVE